MKGALWGFLGTYVSRYSDYDGYWLFGFLVPTWVPIRIDLLDDAPANGSRGPVAVAVALARSKFREQLVKAGFDGDAVEAATLTIDAVEPARADRFADFRAGYNVAFVATATMGEGRMYDRKLVVFVAPHDEAVESRSGRALDRD